jgi:hypothetical protein
MLTTLTVGGPVQPWIDFGLPVDARSEVVVAGLRLIIDPDRPPGLVAWAGEGVLVSDIDGIPTGMRDAPGDDTPGSLLSVMAWDHVVVMTNDLERTCAAIEACTHAPLKRIREAGPIRQGFHRWGRTIIEVVESSQVTAGSAALWGLVWTVADLDAEVERLGPDRISPPKAAVQPGRRIATVRASAGLGVPVALMSA